MYDFIDKSLTSYHAVKNTENILLENGFREVLLSERWELKSGDKAYVKKDGALIAFEVGKKMPWESGLSIIASHSDSPCFKLKPNYMMKKEKNYCLVNTEVYGGPLFYTWLDRPLTLAGEAIVKDGSNLKTYLVNGDEFALVIPSLAIHMNRDANTNLKFNPQKELLPVMCISEEKDRDFVREYVSKEINVKKEDIVDFDLFLVPKEGHKDLGFGEMVLSPRLDNLSMAYTSLMALVKSKENTKTKVFSLYNNEEIGSETKEGADCPFLSEVIERIVLLLGGDRVSYMQAVAKSFFVSADLAHAVHPTKNDMADPTNRPLMGKGLVIKHSARGSYITNGKSAAYFKTLCKKFDLDIQEFANASDQRGGSTVGPITLSHMAVDGIDVGAPILGMHSIMETGVKSDFENAENIFTRFYEDDSINID